MGTTAQKLEYLNTTKGLIKDSINLTGANILSTDTFRSYATKLKNGLVDILNNGTDTLYSNFPKVSGEGIEIALNNTYEAPIKLNVVKGDTTQDSYTGKNQIGLQDLAETTNKGLTYSVSNGVLTVNGTAIGKVDFQQMLFNLTQNTSKTLYFYLESGTFTAGAIGIHLNQDIDTQISFIQIPYSTTNLKTTKTIGLSNINQVWVYAVLNSVFNNAKFRIMLSDNNNDTYEPYVGGKASPNPDYPQNVNVVTGSQSINVVGKNLYNSSFRVNNTISCSNGTATENDGIFTFTAAGSDMYIWNIRSTGSAYTTSAGELYEFKKNTYTMTLTNDLFKTNLVTYYDENKISLGYTNKNASSFTISNTDKTGAKYFTIRIGYNSATSGTTYTTSIQLEAGNQPTTYEPYKSATYTVDLGTLELCKIGDYQDTLQKSVGNQFIDFSNMIASTNASCSFTNGVFNVTATGGTYTNARYDITDLYKNNAGKTMKFTYDSIDVSSQYGSIVQLSVEYNDGTPTWYPYFLNHDLVSSTRTIPNDTSNVQQVMFRVYPNNSSTSQSASVTITNPMLQFGTDTLNYEPYGKVWYKKANIGKLILDGEYENWTIDTWFTSTDNSTHFKYAFNKYNDNYARCISNYFIYKSGREQNNGEMNTNLPAKFLLLSMNTISTVEDFKIWLGTHNVNVYYVLQTPTYEIITDTTLINQLESIKSKEDSTNITISGNLPMIVNASALEKE